MSKSPKTIPQKGALFNAQYDMCDSVYRKLNELMLSVGELDFIIEFEELKFRISINQNNSDSIVDFYHVAKNGRTNLGYVNVKKISLSQLEDPMIIFFSQQEEFKNKKPEIYSKWFLKMKEVMQGLLDKQEKYEEIIDDIKSMPIFSPTREVLIEKTQQK